MSDFDDKCSDPEIFDCGLPLLRGSDISREKDDGAVNCWEYISCGREPGGSNVNELGPCPAATFEVADGFLGGNNAGRACVYVVGTFCSATLEGMHRDKHKPCINCAFYHHLRKEHGEEMSHGNFIAFLSKRASFSNLKKSVSPLNPNLHKGEAPSISSDEVRKK